MNTRDHILNKPLAITQTGKDPEVMRISLIIIGPHLHACLLQGDLHHFSVATKGIEFARSDIGRRERCQIFTQSGELNRVSRVAVNSICGILVFNRY